MDINFKKLDYILEKLNLEFPVSELSKKTGYSESTISPYIAKKIKPSTKFLQSILVAYDISLDGFNQSQEATELKPTLGIPYYDVEFTASFLEVFNNQNNKPDSYISHPFFKGCNFVVRNSGQSMAKVIAHGDAIGLVNIPNWKEFFPFGEIYAIVTKDGFRMVKVITQGSENDTYTLISKPTDSKKDEFPPQQIKKESITHLYRVQATSHLF